MSKNLLFSSITWGWAANHWAAADARKHSITHVTLICWGQGQGQPYSIQPKFVCTVKSYAFWRDYTSAYFVVVFFHFMTGPVILCDIFRNWTCLLLLPPLFLSFFIPPPPLFVPQSVRLQNDNSSYILRFLFTTVTPKILRHRVAKRILFLKKYAAEASKERTCAIFQVPS